MGKKHYSQSIKDEAVLFYELGHSFAETQAKYGMAESTFFTWKQKFDKAHLVHAAITTNRATSHKSKRHLEKLALELEVLRQCPCGSKASIGEKVAAVNALCGRYSIHVLCDALSLPRGTYYNRKRREGQRTSYEINDEKLKPLIRQIFHDSKNRFGRKPIHHKLAELGYKVSEKRIPGFEGEKLTTVEKIQLFSFTVGHCSIHSRYFALVIFLAFNFFFCLHHSFKKSPTSSKSSKSKTISMGTHPLQPCSQSYQINVRIISSGVSALVKKFSSRTFNALAISLVLLSLGVRNPDSYWAMRFAAFPSKCSRSPSSRCVSPLCLRTSLIFSPSFITTSFR